MTDESSSDFDDLRPRTWLDAFPWLRGFAVTPEQGWETAIDDAIPSVRERRLAQISELAIERLPHWTIGQVIPGLSPSLDLRIQPFTVRAHHALGRMDCHRGSDIAGVTVRGLMDWHQAGIKTVGNIMKVLADVSMSVATPAVTRPWRQPADVSPSVDGAPPAFPPWMPPLIHDITLVARWNAMIGMPGVPLLSEPVGAGTPDEIVQARGRLATLSADDILDETGLNADLAGLLDDALQALDPRAAQVLTLRVFADEPATLDSLGQRYGVTQERIRQIESKASGAILGFISQGGSLAMVASTARILIGTIRPLGDLLAVMPALGKEVPLAGQPAWRVLDRLDDAYEIEDGWCVVPTMSAAHTVTQSQLQERADSYGLVRLDDLDLVKSSQPERQTELTAAWLTHCGYVITDGYVLTRTKPIGDYGAAILSIAGSPLSVQEILDRLVVERNATSLRNAMGNDDRFERIDRDRWALKEWGLEAYAGIRSVIREQVAHSGGRARLNELVEYITGRYTVTASSVIAYSSSPPFDCRDGIVRMATDDREIRKTPEQTRRLFRRPGAWGYRIRITTDHLRGSGSVAPMAIASILDIHFGQTRQLESTMGPQSVAWTGIQPQFGTIRRFLIDMDISAGTLAFLVIHDDRRFTFEVVRELTGDQLGDALTLVGATTTANVDQARAALTAAIGLPETSPLSSLIGRYRERGDTDIAELLTSVRKTLETGHVPEPPSHRADVDEILELL